MCYSIFSDIIKGRSLRLWRLRFQYNLLFGVILSTAQNLMFLSARKTQNSTLKIATLPYKALKWSSCVISIWSSKLLLQFQFNIEALYLYSPCNPYTTDASVAKITISELKIIYRILDYPILIISFAYRNIY